MCQLHFSGEMITHSSTDLKCEAGSFLPAATQLIYRGRSDDEIDLSLLTEIFVKKPLADDATV